MKLRTLTAAAAAALALGGVAGCRTDVGNAATVDGHRISESEVNHYITANARTLTLPISANQTIDVQPRTFVLQTLIERQLLEKLIKQTPNGGPTTGQLAQLRGQVLGGKSPTALAHASRITGFTPAFDREWVRVRVYETVLSTYQQRGFNVRALVQKTKFPVSVSPRYGTWNAAQFSLDASANAGLPSFVSLQPQPSRTADAGTGSAP